MPEGPSGKVVIPNPLEPKPCELKGCWTESRWALSTRKPSNPEGEFTEATYCGKHLSQGIRIERTTPNGMVAVREIEVPE